MNRAALAASLVAVLSASSLVAEPQTGTRTIYVNVVDKKDVPVPGLDARDFVIKEAGKPAAIVSAAPATTSAHVVILIDDNGFGVPELREGLRGFVQALSGKAQIALLSTHRNEPTLVELTRDTPSLLAGIEKIRPESVDGNYFRRHVRELARQFATEPVERPLIVAVTVDFDCRAALASSHSMPQCGDEPLIAMGAGPSWPVIAEDLERSPVTFFGLAARHNATHDHDPLYEAAAELSGGHVHTTRSDAGIPVALGEIAREILSQYAITYTSVAAQRGAKLQVRLNRPGVLVRARQYLPGR